MRYVVALLLLVASPALAEGQLPPWLQEPGEVIDGPIDVDDCILIEWTEKSPDGYRYTFPRRPMKPNDIQAVYVLRGRGEIVVYSCASTNA